jgi:NDP-sugar pyrophosphorylase family protein
MIRNAVVMAGGKGARLRPLTYHKPKPLLEYEGKPLIDHVIDGLKAGGICRVFVSVNYLGDMVKEYLGSSVEYIEEAEEMGTAGSLGLLPDMFGGDIIVCNGDLITDFDFGKFGEHHVKSGAMLTIGTRRIHHAVPYGVVEHDNGIYIDEKPVTPYNVYGGIIAMNMSIARKVKGRTEMTDLINDCAKTKMLTDVYPIGGVWKDMGRHEDWTK